MTKRIRMKLQSLLAVVVIGMIILSIEPLATTAMSEEAPMSRPTAIQGTLQLAPWPLSVLGAVALDGEWEFYWQQSLTFEQEASEMEPSLYASVPNTWRQYRLDGQSLPRYGYATYRLLVQMHESDRGTLAALYMPSVATAYRLWVNKQLLAESGTFGKQPEQMTAYNQPQVISFLVDEPQLELIIEVSNFHQRKAGLWESIHFGTAEHISHMRERKLMLQTFMMGSLFMMGCYHLILFVWRLRELSPLYLAVTCFGVCLRTLLLNDVLFFRFFPYISWESAVKLEYGSGLIALLAFFLFAKIEFFPQIPRLLRTSIVAILLGYCGFVLVTPPRIFTNTYTLFQILLISILVLLIIAACIGIQQRRRGAILYLFGTMIVFFAILNDLLYYRQQLNTGELVSISLFIFLFIQSIQLSRRYAYSFHHVEKLSQELQYLNASLEEMVLLRTKELRKANERLHQMEEARRRLLSSVSHELNTPLASIQGYVKAMLDGVVSRDDSTYLRAVYEDTQMMSHMIRDLQELSMLESGAMTFQFVEVDFRQCLRQWYEEQRSVLNNKGLRYDYIEQLNGQPEDVELRVMIDPVRIKQVYMNLLINAQKFTPPGGIILMRLMLLLSSTDQERYIKVSIRDTGYGIAEKDLPHLFERFYKADVPDEHAVKGAGLGLSIAKEIIEAHHGSIGVQSMPKQGSDFYFLLPIQSVEYKRGSHRDEKGKGTNY